MEIVETLLVELHTDVETLLWVELQPKVVFSNLLVYISKDILSYVSELFRTYIYLALLLD